MAAYEINNDNMKQWKSHITRVQKGYTKSAYA